MPHDAELLVQLRKVFLEKLHVEVPSHDTDLVEKGIMDSMMLVDLLLHLEDEFQVKISMETLEIDDFRSVNAIVAFLLRTRSNGSAGKE
jgi:acyl carrier protein